MAPAIEVSGLTKRFGEVLAVDDLSFTVDEGRIVGFLGPNGAGKTTTLRMLLGLVNPTAGSSTVFGTPYRQLDDPVHTVGAVLDGGMLHPGRTGRNHLLALAKEAGVAGPRVDELLELVALSDAKNRRAGGYSPGMRQRLGLAAALLGDPKVLVLDEPANGLDPQGIRWLRDFLRRLAGEGRAILVSSHVLAEVAQTADDVVVINRGRLSYQGSIGDFTRRAGGDLTRVRAADVGRLRPALQAAGATLREGADHGALLVADLDAPAIGEIALREGVALHELTAHGASLEDVFL